MAIDFDYATAERIMKRLLAMHDRPAEPPRVLEAGDRYADQVRVVYVDTGDQVPDVFQYDLDRGECWQYVRAFDGNFEMDGRDFKMRRVIGDLRAEWVGPEPSGLCERGGFFVVHDEVVHQEKPSREIDWGLYRGKYHDHQVQAYRTLMENGPWVEAEKRILTYDPKTSLPNPCGESESIPVEVRTEKKNPDGSVDVSFDIEVRNAGEFTATGRYRK